MDISSKAKYPANALSNFAPHRFTIDGVECHSMEGFLQSLKFKNPDMQVEVCKLVGLAAKMKGANKNWQRTQTLWWRGEPIGRSSDQYQELLDRAFNAMLDQSEGFRKALLATGDASLTHAMGKTDSHQTVLTKTEFCSRLNKMRELVKQK